MTNSYQCWCHVSLIGSGNLGICPKWSSISSVVTVLDFSFSIGFGLVLEEKPRFQFRFSVLVDRLVLGCTSEPTYSACLMLISAGI